MQLTEISSVIQQSYVRKSEEIYCGFDRRLYHILKLAAFVETTVEILLYQFIVTVLNLEQ